MAHKKLWHPIKNVGVITSKHTQTYGVIEVMDFHENL
jgi:hypothetical protein